MQRPYTQEEIAKKLRKSDRTIRGLSSKELKSLGFSKVGTGKGTRYYDVEENKDGDSANGYMDINKLKAMSLAAQIKKAQVSTQQLVEKLTVNRNVIIMEFLDGNENEPGFRQKAIDAFEPLRKAFTAAKLTEEQSIAINNGLDEALENFRSISV